MKGHIRRRGKSSWAVVVFLGRDPSGKQHRKWHAVRGTRRDAQRELARLINEFNTGAYIEPARMTVSEFLDRWLTDYAKPKVSPKTYERYQEMIDGHIRPALGSYLLPKLSPLHLQAFYGRALAEGRKDGKGGLSPQSVVHFHRLLHKAFDQALKWQLIARNPLLAVEPPSCLRSGKRTRPLLLLRLLEGNSSSHAGILGRNNRPAPRRDSRVCGGPMSISTLSKLSWRSRLSRQRQVCDLIIPKTHRSRRSIALAA